MKMFVAEYERRVASTTGYGYTADKFVEIAALVEHIMKGSSFEFIVDRWKYLGEPKLFVERKFYR